MTISKGDAKSFKNGAKMYESILNKISAVKGLDAYSPIKNTSEYLRNVDKTSLKDESVDYYEDE